MKPEDFSAFVTAWATVALVLATGVLAYLTWILAKATRIASVVVTIEASKTSIKFADLHVVNEGNVTAYDVQIRFDPPLPKEGGQFDNIMFPSAISVLRAGQEVVSSLCETFVLVDEQYQFHVSWKKKPDAWARKSITYPFDLGHLKQMATLGDDPSVQAANELTKIREAVVRISSGASRIKIDQFSQIDRDTERQKVLEAHAERAGGSPSILTKLEPGGRLVPLRKAFRELVEWAKA